MTPINQIRREDDVIICAECNTALPIGEVLGIEDEVNRK
jgi:hypothetical protein